MKRNLSLLVAAASLLIAPRVGLAQNALPVINDTNGPMELWVRKDQPSVWRYPPLVVYRGETGHLVVEGPGPCYLVVRDDSRPRRDYALGWYDLHEELRKDPGLKLRMSIVYEFKMREVRVWCRRARSYVIVREEARVGIPIISWETSKKARSDDK